MNDNRKSTALTRAEQDIARGDRGLARHRVACFLNSKGYDPEVLAWLGEISHQMGDEYEAGRYWLTSSADGEAVERAIRGFIHRHRGDLRQCYSQLPAKCRRGTLAAYPQAVQTRMRALGFDDKLGPTPEPSAILRDEFQWGCLGAALVVLLIACLAIVGFIHMLGELRKWMGGN